MIHRGAGTALALAYRAFRVQRDGPDETRLSLLHQRETEEAARRWAVVSRHSNWGVAIIDRDGASRSRRAPPRAPSTP